MIVARPLTNHRRNGVVPPHRGTAGAQYREPGGLPHPPVDQEELDPAVVWPPVQVSVGPGPPAMPHRCAAGLAGPGASIVRRDA